jgi:hypothetical protein
LFDSSGFEDGKGHAFAEDARLYRDGRRGYRLRVKR